MADKVQRGGEVEPDGPNSGEAEQAADRGEGKIAPRTPGKAEGMRREDNHTRNEEERRSPPHERSSQLHERGD